MPNFSGKWNLQGQLQGIKQGDWTGIPLNELYAWGDNSPRGQLGINDTIDRSSPIQVGTLGNWLKVTGGDFGSQAVKTDGTLWSWGVGQGGRVGNNNTIDVSSPVQIGALTNWSQISGRSSQRAALTTDGELYVWGTPSYGKLGLNDVAYRSSPTQVGSLSNWAQVSTGSYNTAAVTTDGKLYVWGRNNRGQIGDNTVVDRSSPVQIGSLTDWSQVSIHGGNCAAIKTDGTIWTWGFNNSGQIGKNYENISKSSPVQVGALTNWSQVAVSNGNHVIAIKTDGTLWAWGNGDGGALGDNTTTSNSSPVQIGSDTNWSQTEVANQTTAAVKTDGTLWTWGNNGNGRLGTNTDQNVDVSSPVQVGSLTSWSNVAVGAFHMIAVNEARTGMS